MDGSPVDAEIGMRLAGTMDLGPDAGVVGNQGAVRQAGPEFANLFIEGRGPGGVDRLVQFVDELQVRAEMRLAAEVAAIVGSECARDRRRIDQT